MFREHKHEIITAAIGFAISFALALAITGDFGDALARSKR
jgi:hypothetical protein